MKKLKEYVDLLLDGKQIRGVYLPPASVWCLIDIYNELVQNKTPKFIDGSVKMVLDKCGIRTEEYEIGWIALST